MQRDIHIRYVDGRRTRERNGVRKRKPRPDRVSIGREKSLSFQNSERSRALFMEAADSDKDSKSSELTIGPSCIQFRLIIVKVEKFQSAVSGHPRDIPTALPLTPCCRPPSRLGSPSEKEREREFSLFFLHGPHDSSPPPLATTIPCPAFPHSFLRVPDCRTILSRVYDFRLYCLHYKGKFSRSASTISGWSTKETEMRPLTLSLLHVL